MSKLKLVILFVIFISNLYGGEYEDYLKQQRESFNTYKENINKEFKAYKKAYEESFKEYKKDITKRWPVAQTTSKHKWVEYSKDYSTKEVIDYKKGEISLEVIAKSEKEAQQKIINMYNKLDKYDVKQAYKNDILENKIAVKLDKVREAPKSNQKLIADIISRQQNQVIKEKLSKQKLKVVKYKGRFIYKANIKLPANSMIKKAKFYKKYVKRQSKKLGIPQELIYAIIHSESSFNPMARSYVPAFGLMQIVPRTAGLDTYKYLTGKRRLLSSRYLYDYKNNIIIGSTYLKILSSRYLKNVKDPQSRLYCTIAAYNTGAGNVSRAFNGTTNIYKSARVINKMSSDQVYKRLMKKLPRNETKRYLYKVNNRISIYHKLIKDNRL